MTDTAPLGPAPNVTAAPPAATAGPRFVGKTRNPWGVWLLTLITFGIYGLWWYYTINREVRDYDRRVVVSPGVSLLAITLGACLVGVPPLVSVWRTAGRISKAQEAAGSPARCGPFVGLLLFMVGFGMVYYQSKLNKVWDRHGNPPERTEV